MRNQPASVQYPASPLNVEGSTQNGGDTPVTGTLPSLFMCYCLCFCSCDAVCALLTATHSLYGLVSSCCCCCCSCSMVSVSRGQQIWVCIRSVTDSARLGDLIRSSRGLLEVESTGHQQQRHVLYAGHSVHVHSKVTVLQRIQTSLCRQGKQKYM